MFLSQLSGFDNDKSIETCQKSVEYNISEQNILGWLSKKPEIFHELV